MKALGRRGLVALMALGCAACAADPAPTPPVATSTVTVTVTADPTVSTSASASPTPSESAAAKPSSTPSGTASSSAGTPSASRSAGSGIVKTDFGAHYDPSVCSVSSEFWQGNRRFYLTGTADDGCFTSPWFGGVHPVMLSYGPTIAPWYGKGGSHHGVDIDMPVGTPIRSAVDGVMHRQPSTMGAAYGSNAALIRADGHDYVLGHLSKVLVADGARVRVGQLIGYSGVSGVEDEDGPHLHFEVRPAGGTFKSAVDPWAPLRTSLTSA